MPRTDPAPRLRASHLRHFRRAVKLLALLSLAIAALAVLLMAGGDQGTHIHIMIATALGVGLTVFLATGLVSLVFLNWPSDHDRDTARHDESDAK